MIRTYIDHDGKTYLVSTINRESSVVESGGMKYAETMVWEWDAKNRVRVSDQILYQGEAAEGSIWLHQKTVEHIHANGIPKDHP